MKSHFAPLSLILALTCCTPALLGSDKIPPSVNRLALGATAPEFKPAVWIQGEPVTTFANDKTYLIDFWATFCSPCIDEIPHINELHNKLKDKGLIVIGVDVREKLSSLAEAFVKRKGDRMAYRVVHDTGPIAREWLDAAQIPGIPHAFIIHKNTVVWHGRAGDLDEKFLTEILEGRYSPFDKSYAPPRELFSCTGTAAEARYHRKLGADFQKLIREKKADEAALVLEKWVEATEVSEPDSLPLIREDGLFEIALLRGDKTTAAARLKAYGEAGAKIKYRVATQYRTALKMMTDPRLAGVRDYAASLVCLDRLGAGDPDAENAPEILRLRARCLAATGKTDEAVRLLVRVATHPKFAVETNAAIKALKAGKPWPIDEVNPDAPALAKEAR